MLLCVYVAAAMSKTKFPSGTKKVILLLILILSSTVSAASPSESPTEKLWTGEAESPLLSFVLRGFLKSWRVWRGAVGVCRLWAHRRAARRRRRRAGHANAPTWPKIACGRRYGGRRRPREDEKTSAERLKTHSLASETNASFTQKPHGHRRLH